MEGANLSPETPGASVVDEFVDMAYLARCAHVWAVTSNLARSVLDQVDRGAPVEHDQDRRRAVQWLQAAAGRDDAAVASTACDAGGCATTLDLLAHVAAAYPRFLTGEVNGRAVLLTGAGRTLWNAYFQSTNLLYAPVNQVAAATVHRLVAARGGARVLEVGAGTGGTTVDVLRRWPVRVGGEQRYTVTDASPALLVGSRRGLQEAAPPNVEMDFRRFDFDTAEPAITAGSVDVIVAANSLHNATDLVATLRGLHSLLAPGGALVVSESLCGLGELVHQEFVFNLLPMDAGMLRRGSRFLSSAAWQAVFAAAGIAAQVQVNTAGPELVMVAVAEDTVGQGA